MLRVIAINFTFVENQNASGEAVDFVSMITGVRDACTSDRLVFFVWHNFDIFEKLLHS